MKLIRELGLNGFRFSIAWPRILPEGRGQPNSVGLDFYDRLVDELLAAGIEPFVTLYHWDLPQALEERGGWPARETAEAFAEYVDVVSEQLGDGVRHWITQCEPWVVSWLGYGLGEHAPGRTSEADALAAAHHVLLSHGLAAQVLRRRSAEAKVGITIDLVALHPLTDSRADADAVRRLDGSRNRWILDPVLRGEYPADMLEAFAPILPDRRQRSVDDRRSTRLPRRQLLHAQRRSSRSGEGCTVLVRRRQRGASAMGWEMYPDGLFELLVRLHDDYSLPPLYVTENGAAYADERSNGTVEDPRRIAYVERHLNAIARAIDHGVPVRGYFLWSLLDNFEWALGFSKRFGIVYVDFETLERVPKGSYAWYRDFIAAQRATQASP